MDNQPFIETLFPEVANFDRLDYARSGSDRPTLMIAMTARTGSSHLCSGLSSALPIGMPPELFNARDFLVWDVKRRGVLTFADLIADFLRESKAIVVFKTSWLDFDYFKDWVWDMFPNLKIVYLSRLDVEAQAVSLYKAEVSGDWHDSPMIERPAKMSEEDLAKRFDLIEICRRIAAIDKEKLNWEKYFFARRIQPMRVAYENFQHDLAPAVQMVARYMGCEIDAANVSSSFRSVSDDVSGEWLTKVRNYRSGRFYQRFKSGTPVSL